MLISPLRDRPGFADTIADRAWHAWWTDSGVPLATYRAHLDPMIEGAGIPLALVAHEGNAYLGSVLVIEDDLPARPQYAPWIAALWVEPERRRQGVAARLMEAAQAEAGRLGHESCYLCAEPRNWPYYLARGFRVIEPDVDGLGASAREGRGGGDVATGLGAPTPPSRSTPPSHTTDRILRAPPRASRTEASSRRRTLPCTRPPHDRRPVLGACGACGRP